MFSQAYKTLFDQFGGQQELCYMPEILDSAQENFPHLYVNGEKYVFSDDVINAGTQLFKNFNQLKVLLASFDPDCFETFERQLKNKLSEFDKSWTQYE
jgi:hypothetical protein